ncbi:MAG: hypothetical protein J0H18_01485 [Rhizobiales bacterium]|nr:hypothetical protein [Hyphomicrobiales bacterium]OJY07544.1 MAG: hypothetical protein BGP07_06680 [Rhizobiales bacterium 63-22]
MLRTLSDEIALNLKDRLRDVRYAIRRARSTAHGAENRLPAPELLLGQAAGMVDTALTAAEAISISLISSEPAQHRGAARMRGLNLYFGASAEGTRAFRRDMYYFLKDMLRRAGLENVLIHETAFALVHGRMMRRHEATLAAIAEAGTEQAKIAAAAEAAAALFMETMAEQPARFPPSDAIGDRDRLRKAEIAAIAAASLLSALATVKPAEMAEADDPLEGVLLAIEARRERLAEAAGAGDAKKLETLFAMLIAHLP